MKTLKLMVSATFAALLVLTLAADAQAQSGAKVQEGSAAKVQEGSAAKTQEGPKTIAQSIDPNTFSTLYHAVNSAGLTETLNGAGPFTVFAPNDTAFGTLPLGDVQGLFQPANKELLAAVLKHHVVQGKVMAADVVGLSEAKSVLGETLKIEAKDGKVMINGVNVVTTDIVCSNGVIHVIDGVFMPSAEAMAKIKESMAAQGSAAKEGSATKGSETKGSETKGSETKGSNTK